MAKIPLTIDKNYCSDWGVYQGVRELIQNAKDAEDDGHEMTVEHFPRTSRLVITSAGVYVEPSKLLVLGKSDKVPGQRRGQFGEGFVLGILALMRKECDVTFKNGSLSWSAGFEEPDHDHPLAGSVLLTFKSRSLGSKERDFQVEVNNIPTEVWALLRPLFLFLTPAKNTIETSQGAVLLDEEHQGHVFSRGIFVRKFEDLRCGYDLRDLPLDRDRRFVDEWDLHYKLGRMWNEACAKNPEIAAPRLYHMAKTGAVEVRQVKYHADEKILEKMRERFIAENGDTAIPCATTADAKTVTEIGGTPTMVNEVLRELLDKGGLSVEKEKKRLEQAIVARHEPGDVSASQADMLAKLQVVVPVFELVTFKGKGACRLIDGNTAVAMDVRLLDGDYEAALRALVTAEAQRRGVEPYEVALAHIVKTS